MATLTETLSLGSKFSYSILSNFLLISAGKSMKNETIPEFVLQKHNDATISSFFRRCACSLFSSARLHIGKVGNFKFPVSSEKMLFIFCKCDTVQITVYEICVSALSGWYSSSPPAHMGYHVRCLSHSKFCSGHFIKMNAGHTSAQNVQKCLVCLWSGPRVSLPGLSILLCQLARWLSCVQTKPRLNTGRIRFHSFTSSRYESAFLPLVDFLNRCPCSCRAERFFELLVFFSLSFSAKHWDVLILWFWWMKLLLVTC